MGEPEPVGEAVTLSLASVIARSESVLFSQVGADVVAFHMDRGVYIDLNEVGGHIWQMLEEPKPVGVICEALIEAYGVEASVCESETLAFLQGIYGEGLIVIT